MLVRPVIHLASASPRRRELLTQIGIPFELVRSEVDETPQDHEAAHVYVERLALAKASAGWMRAQVLGMEPQWLLAADTTVALGDVILGKPEDEDQARDMLQRLSGTLHEVMTGIAVASEYGVTAQVVCSEVRFRDLSQAEIDAYIATQEPFDKAGAYGIQGVGAILVAEMRGSFSGVVGLPLTETVTLLQQAGYPYWGGNR